MEDKYIKYWMESSENDYDAMKNLYKSKNYNWCLFIGHLVIEKLLKGLYVKNNHDIKALPKVHNLLLLAERCGLKLDSDKLKKLKVINTFNIAARYDDYKKAFYNKCTYDYTTNQLKNIEEMREWLIEILMQK